MSKHPDACTVDRKISPDEALADPNLVARANELHSSRKVKSGFRRLLMLGAGLATLAGGSYYG